jgi:hypothetical protein
MGRGGAGYEAVGPGRLTPNRFMRLRSVLG